MRVKERDDQRHPGIKNPQSRPSVPTLSTEGDEKRRAGGRGGGRVDCGGDGDGEAGD